MHILDLALVLCMTATWANGHDYAEFYNFNIGSLDRKLQNIGSGTGTGTAVGTGTGTGTDEEEDDVPDTAPPTSSPTPAPEEEPEPRPEEDPQTKEVSVKIMVSFENRSIDQIEENETLMGVIRAAGCRIFEATDDTCDKLTVTFEEPAAAPAGITERRLQSSTTFLIIYSMFFPAEEADRKAAVFESMDPESVFAVIEQEFVNQGLPTNSLFVHGVCTTEECAEPSHDDSDEEDDETVTPEPVEPETEAPDADATTSAPDVDTQSTDDDETAADANGTTNNTNTTNQPQQ